MNFESELDKSSVEVLRKNAERYLKLRAGRYSLQVAKSILNDTPEGIDAAVDALPPLGPEDF